MFWNMPVEEVGTDRSTIVLTLTLCGPMDFMSQVTYVLDDMS